MLPRAKVGLVGYFDKPLQVMIADLLIAPLPNLSMTASTSDFMIGQWPSAILINTWSWLGVRGMDHFVCISLISPHTTIFW